MKTAKQEAIKNAYGEYWEQVKDYVDEDGWIEYSDIDISEMIEIENTGDGYDDDIFYRPKSLVGIENNKGWIKIESENDLPKEYCSCWCIVDEVVINAPLNFNPITKQFHGNTLFQKYEWFSHYQPIIKPQPPIY